MPDEDAIPDEARRTRFLPYDPGPLPVAPPPSPGDSITLDADGLPPEKIPGRSLRNPTNPRYHRVQQLRRKAITAMAGRAWYRGPVLLDVEVWVRELEANRTLLDYVGGVMDTLDGGHGPHFTYLPIVYEDDAQVSSGKWRLYEDATHDRYQVKATFMAKGAA